jgi:hypothetical protein
MNVSQMIAKQLATGLCFSVLFSPFAASQTAADRTFEIAPYAWGPALSGEVGLQGAPIPLALDSDDIIKDVEAGAMGILRVRQGNYFAVGEGIWLKYKDPQSGLFLDQRADVDLKVASVGVGRSWSLHSGTNKIEISPFVGLQALEIEAAVSGPLVSATSSNQWLDPVVGLILEAESSNRISLAAKIDITGLGNPDTEQVSLYGAANYALSDTFALSAGYRWANANYRGGDGFHMDLNGHGPMVGLVLKMGSDSRLD